MRLGGDPQELNNDIMLASDCGNEATMGGLSQFFGLEGVRSLSVRGEFYPGDGNN
jgi:hypothetical protein